MKTSKAFLLLAERAVVFPDVPSGQLMMYEGDGEKLSLYNAYRMTDVMQEAGLMPTSLPEILESNNPKKMHEARVLAYCFGAVISAEQGD